jgi:hypothetical protein
LKKAPALKKEPSTKPKVRARVRVRVRVRVSVRVQTNEPNPNPNPNLNLPNTKAAPVKVGRFTEDEALANLNVTPP